jgi:hypothetical protein
MRKQANVSTAVIVAVGIGAFAGGTGSAAADSPTARSAKRCPKGFKSVTTVRKVGKRTIRRTRCRRIKTTTQKPIIGIDYAGKTSQGLPITISTTYGRGLPRSTKITVDIRRQCVVGADVSERVVRFTATLPSSQPAGSPTTPAGTRWTITATATGTSAKGEFTDTVSPASGTGCIGAGLVLFDIPKQRDRR